MVKCVVLILASSLFFISVVNGSSDQSSGAFGVIWDREMDRAKREHIKFLEEVLLIRVIN